MKANLALVSFFCAARCAVASNLLANGDFNAPSILGPGQTEVGLNERKIIQPDETASNFPDCVSGIQGWTYAVPEWWGSDHGPANTDGFGNPAGERMVFINNWGRTMSQTVASVSLQPGQLAVASIDFGTLGDPGDDGRAGTFFLVAGQADPANPDQFTPDSIVLQSVTVGNPAWNARDPQPDPLAQVTVVDGVLINLQLTYAFLAGDPALNKPLTVAFRTEAGSVGPTYWDNARLEVIPEPSAYGSLIGLAAVSFGLWRKLAAR